MPPLSHLLTIAARMDPRPLAHRFPRATVAVFTLLTAVMLWGNTLTTKGGILDDPITDPTNAARQSDLFVRELRAEGFDAGETVPFILHFPDGIRTPADLARVRDFTERVKRAFGPAVVSLATIADYRDTGDALANDPYVPLAVPGDYDVAAWRARVAADPTVYGVFVGRDFTWAAVLRYLPHGYDDIVEFRRTADFLEERSIPWWEWLVKTDIATPPGVGVAGWVVGRGLLDQALTIDNLTLVGVGVALALPLLVWFLQSLRAALLGLGVVVLLGFVWCRGSIGLLDLIGIPVRERVYVLLAYTNCIVQGVSFVLHKFEALDETTFRPGAPRDLPTRWRLAVGNDHLIGATALIAIFGFATLGTFQVLAIRELGLLSALAVAYQVALALLLLPAAHCCIGEGRVRRPDASPRGTRAMRATLDRMVRGATALVLRYPPRRSAALTGGFLFVLAFGAVLVVWPGDGLLVKTYPLHFITGTTVERTAEFLNEPGRLGFAMRDLLVTPADPATDVYDPAFLAAAAAYEHRLADDPLVRETASILDQVGRVARASFGTPLPQSREEVHAAFGIVDADLDRGVARQLFFAHGIRLVTTFEGNDSTRMSAIGAHAEALAREFPSLRVHPFGKSALYGEVDHYIRIGKPWNVLSSQLVVIVFCCVGVWINNRRLGLRRGRALSPLTGGCIMSVPFVFASALMVFLMAGLRIPLDAATAAITALAINASVDFSIYLADAYQEGEAHTGDHAGAVRHALADKGRMVLADMLLNAVCFFPLTFSRFQPVHELGWIMMVMLAACGFGTVVLMPALLSAAMTTAPDAALADATLTAAPRKAG